MASGPPDDGSILPEGWTLSDVGHGALDVAGLVPGYGEAADVANALWYANEAKYLEAGLSLISTVPIVGDAIGKGGKLVGKLGGPALRKLVPLLRKADFAAALAPFRKNPKLAPHIDKMIAALDQWKTKLIDRAYGVESCAKDAADAVAADAKFVPSGWNGDPMESAVGQEMVAQYEKQLAGQYERAEDLHLAAKSYAQELMNSGTALPKATSLQAGDKLYKLAVDTPKGHSAYWMTKTELDNLAGLSDLQVASHLGLPAQSLPASGKAFQVHEIIAKEATTVFQSTVAPVAQGAWRAGGGATQTLVPHRALFDTGAPPKMFGR